jgi:hypothetical protein
MKNLLLVAAVLLFIGTACRLVGDSVEVKDTPVELDVKPTHTVTDIQVTETKHCIG